MDDVKVALEELKEESDSGKLAGIPPTARAHGGGCGLAAVAAAALLLAAAVLVWRLREGTPPSDLRAVALTPIRAAQALHRFLPTAAKWPSTGTAKRKTTTTST